MDQGLSQDRDIDVHRPLSNCEVGNDQKLPLEVQLALAENAEYQENQTFMYSRSKIRLPPDLGRAILQSAPEIPNYTVAAAFHCGTNLTWIEIVIRVLQNGRDVKADLSALLRIAETRYSKLAKCQIKAKS